MLGYQLFGVWKTEAELIKIAITLIGTYVVIETLLVSFNSVFDMEWFKMYSFCMGRNFSNTFGFASIRRLSIIGTIILTFFVDIKTFWLIRKYNNENNLNQSENEHIKSDIPMRASLVSLFMVVSTMIILLIIETNENPEQFTKVGMICILFISLPKSPAMVFLTMHVNTTNARIDQDAERERKRQLEIQDAKRRRNERIARQLAMQEEGTLTF